MESMRNILCTLSLIGNSMLLCAAEPQPGRLYIKNDHPTFQFESAYTVGGWQKTQ